MKQCYTKAFAYLAFFILVVYLPNTSLASCMCSNGSPPETQQHTISTNFSSDSTTVFNVPQFNASVFADGSAVEYDYKYHFNTPLAGKLHLRIKQLTGKKAKYPQIKALYTETIMPALNIYPNPVVRDINLVFEEPLSGDYSIELVNQVGQIVLRKKVRLSNSMKPEVQVDSTPPPGIYYLKTRQIGTSKVYSGKLLFTR